MLGGVRFTTTRWSGLLVLLLCGACSSEPDVVATSQTEVLPSLKNVVSDCEEGVYKGSFSTVTEEGSFPLELSGLIEFSLAKSARGGEFLRLGDTKLQGRDPNPAQPAQFKAVIATGECKEGSYEMEITDGEFSFLLPDGGPTGEPVGFEGKIRGEYLLEKHLFYGEWNTVTAVGLKIGGRWSAFLK
jgi:hypothetical protein